MKIPNFLRRFLLSLVLRTMERRPPDFCIGPEGDHYLRRWHVRSTKGPKGKDLRWNVYLHEFLRDDNDEALHDHPYASCSIILANGYKEVMFTRTPLTDTYLGVRVFRVEGDPRNYKEMPRRPGQLVFRAAIDAHRVVLNHDAVGHQVRAISLFIIGPRVRTWGFYCLKGWIPYTKFADVDERSSIKGKGCP